MLLLAAGLVLSGCFAAPEPAPSPTPTGFASEEEAFAAAEATFDGYLEAVNLVDLADAETFEAVYDWTAGDAFANERQSLTNMGAGGLVVSGRTLLSSFEGTSYDSTTGETTSRVCLDVSEVTLNGPEGQTRVSPDRPDIQTLIVVFIPSSSTVTNLAISSIDGTDAAELQCG